MIRGRLLKWDVELNQFDITHTHRTAIKGQALANFVVEFAKAPKIEVNMEPTKLPTWNLFVDGSSGETGSEAGVVLEILEGHKLNCAVRLGFKASNNMAEYEALMAGLRLAKELQMKRFIIISDSQLVVNQVNGRFVARDKLMAAYLKLLMNSIPKFEKFELIQVPRQENSYADALSKLVSSKDSNLLKVVLIEHLAEPSIKCIGGEEANYILKEVYEGICANHSGGLALAHKRQLSQDLTVVSSPWPFAKWGVNFIGALSSPYSPNGWKQSLWPSFSGKNIICLFGIPHSLVSDNSKQFDNRKFRELCDELRIRKHFS
ncbi:unnamed protein product [Fraxinus pennsylvanica]|uniref:RNase H type-1 domain-containing protein n=1 Tax=Fraxinus pennsylvanica TaxID=56036 RepID=A0AAD1Z9N6_9LAMI|nr:unnamed protein product [Fraxinus pennsylvanica]